MPNFHIRTQCDACQRDLVDHNVSTHPIQITELTSNNFRVTNKEYGQAIETVQCTKCHLIQPKYVFPPEFIVKFYSGLNDDEYLESSTLRGKSNFEQVHKIIQKCKPDATRILEIGSGSGTLVSLLQQKYPSVTGVEPSSSFCKFAKDTYNVDIIESGYEGITETGFDVVIVLDVIEHIVSPSDLMSKIAHILNPGGIAIIGTPDISSISAKLLGKKWYHIRPPHIYYFGKESFRNLVNKHNMQMLKEAYFVWSFPIAYLVDAFQKLVLGKALIKNSFAGLTIRINLFDSVVYIIQKS